MKVASSFTFGDAAKGFGWEMDSLISEGCILSGERQMVERLGFRDFRRKLINLL